jgi:hypothetical protein
MPTTTEVAIWDRVLDIPPAELSPDAAQFLLRLDFRESDHQRMAELAARAQTGMLTSQERSDYEDYLRVGNLLAFLQSKARVAMREQSTNGHG